MAISALVFDFDGVILDTERVVLHSWEECYASHGVSLPLHHWLEIVGRSDAVWDPASDLARRIGAPLSREDLEARHAREHELAGALPVMPGVEALLKAGRARGLRLGVASSSSWQWVGGHLRQRRLLPWFDAIVTRDDVTASKPDPAPYREAVARLGVRPIEAVAFEDSANGVASAKAAGLLVVAVPTALTADMDLSAADLRLDSLTELPPLELVGRLA